MSRLQLRWNLNATEIVEGAKSLIQETRSVYDKIGSLKPSEVNVENTIYALGTGLAKYFTHRSLYDFPQHVSPEKELREASTEAEKILSDFDVECDMREDVHQAFLALQKSEPVLEVEAKRFLDHILRDFKRNGLFLEPEARKTAKEIKEKKSKLSIQFSKNMNEENTILEFSEEELEGLPKDFLSSLEKSASGKFQVSLKYPHYFPCMKKAKNPETRRKLELAFCSRCKDENTPILEELVSLRHQYAELLGYKTHSSFITEILMSKNPSNIMKFLEELSAKLQPLAQKELEVFLEIKKKDCEEMGIPFDGKINAWDFRYYANKVEERDFSVNHEEIQQYFPLQVVTKGMFQIYEEILGLRYQKINPSKEEIWHPEVELYEVFDQKTGELFGHFYLDLFPREGKYGHAACFGLQPGCVVDKFEKKEGEFQRQTSVAAMVANFTKPTAEKPSLLTHDEVETYFHEFGHVMHQVCTRAKYAIFSGTNVERDFVEAPSQMLENWCYETQPLKMMSSHIETKETLPDSLIEKLAKSRLANTGLLTKRQLLFAIFDQTIHSMPKADTVALFNQFSSSVWGIPSTEGTSFPASFGHLAGGYDARYYGYLWSEVFSMDMFASRFKGKVLDKTAGKDYRDFILAPGGTVSGDEMLKNFLGREPTQDAFLQSRGL